jgi:hypothetical protein
MANKDDDIDLDKVVWDALYRRQVIERLNREAAPAGAPANRAAPSERLRAGSSVR